MRFLVSFEILASCVLLGCGGSVFNAGASDDAGRDASAGSGGAQADGGENDVGGNAGSAAGGAGGNTGGQGGKGGASGSGPGGSGAGGNGTGGASGVGGAGGTGGSAGKGGGAGTAGTTGRGGAGTGGAGAGGVGGAGTAGAGGTGGAAGTGASGGTGGSAGTKDGGIDWGACSGGGQCVRGRKGCCDPCGVPELDTFAGVNSMYLDAFKMATCPVPMVCPACPTGNNPNIAARCVTNRCEAFDIRKVPEYSGCAVDGDCRLRKGLACCECGAMDDWVAPNVSSEPALSAALCVAGTVCPPCAPVPPVGMRAVCKVGTCQVEPPCTLTPRSTCCFSDATCAGGLCYSAMCATGSEGMCKTRANQADCWGDRDCSAGKRCIGFSICPCEASCLTPDKPGQCG